MKCSKCGKEMKKADGFVEVTKLKPNHRTNVAANCCEECRIITIEY